MSNNLCFEKALYLPIIISASIAGFVIMHPCFSQGMYQNV